MEDIKLTISMVATHVFEVGLSTLIKAAISEGMSNYVFVVYSNAVALSLLLLSSFIYYRKRPSPSITIPIIGKIFLASLFSCASQTLVYTGIGHSSPVLASVMANLSPVFTFVLAIVFRYEKLEMRQVSSYAKCIGTALSITGALIVTLYRGGGGNPKLEDDEWLVGGFLVALGNLCGSIVFNMKTWIMREYPEVLMAATILCGFVVIVSSMVALVAERTNPQAWILQPNVELPTILFSGIIVVTTRNVVQIWVCGKKGPVFVSVFTPLGMVIALAMGLLFLGESLSLGSVIGGCVISVGFYGFLWGQAQQEKLAFQRNVTWSCVSSPVAASTSSNVAPLLQNQS